MCGICGFLGEGQEEALDRMVAALHHRGPDDKGTQLGAGIGLGCTRLAILDLSAAGHQPMANPQKTVWIAYNGETYNFRAERQSLEQKGHRFSSSSDTEVVLAMYEEYGDDFLSRLRAMFALALYDRRRGPGRERLLLARDPFGIKPLLFAHAGQTLVFASEIKALIASGLLRPAVDPEALRQLLTYGAVRQPRTILRGVSMLPPGHYLLVEGGVSHLRAYWRPCPGRQPALRELPPAARRDAMGELLEESTRLQMVSDVPVGAFLSGGIDSTLLVALMARHAGHRVKTFSVGFAGEGADIDESGRGERIARELGSDHTRVLVRGVDVREQLPRIAAALDQPSVDGLNSYFVAEAAARSVTVAISGLGGDELFAGYPWWFESMLNEDEYDLRHPLKARVKRIVAAAARQPILDRLSVNSGARLLGRCRQFGTYAARFAARNTVFPPAEVAVLISQDLWAGAHVGRSFHHDFVEADALPDAPGLERITGLCLRSYMNDQLLRDVDAVSMAHSLEVRVPFLDPLVSDAALSLPPEAKLGRTVSGEWTPGKRVLRDLVAKLVPSVSPVSVKQGFNMPIAAWLRGPLRTTMEDLLTPSLVRRRGFLDDQAVTRAKESFLAGRVAWSAPWVLMMLELWGKEVLDRVV